MGNEAWLFKGAFRVFPLFIALSFVAVGLGACSGAPHIEVEQQEARLSPVLLGVCSVFLRIENSGSGSDRLVRAQADIPGTITELHDVKEGKMTRREEIRIPAKSTVELRPGGLHIMVVKLPREVRVGYEFGLRLVFERSGEKLVSVAVVR